MNWIKSIGPTELVFIAIFFLAYLFFFFRLKRASAILNSSSRSVMVKFFLRSLYLGLMITALLGPSFGITEAEAKTAGKDIFMAIDLSESMNANDVSPSRLEKLKLDLIQLVNQLNNNRIGIILFSSDAYWLTPLTFDLDIVQNYISQLDTDLLESNGTNFSAPIELIKNRQTENVKDDRGQILLFFTDGEDFGNIAKKDITDLQQNGLKSFFTGVGTEQGGNIIKEGKLLTDKDGLEIYTALNKSMIDQLAKWSGTVPFFLDNQNNELNALINAINNVENNLVDNRKIIIQNNKYLYFLIGALILVSLDVVITVKLLKI